MTNGRGLHILLVDDEKIIHQTAGDYLRDAGHNVTSAVNANEALARLETEEFDLALVDIRMPGMDGMALLAKLGELRPVMPVVMITGHGTMDTVIEALRHGATDFLSKPVKLIEVDAVLEKCLNVKKLRQENRHLHETIRGLQTLSNLRTGGGQFIGVSAATEKVRNDVRRAVEAHCDTILILGETGTGKEVVAQDIHAQAASEESPFIAVSCPALTETLLESALFGHIKGTFTGATHDRAGYFEMADGGTLFLDEVGDLSASAQATLLRVIETRKLRRVGAEAEISVNVRLVAATNVHLEALVDAGKFRRDLYYRLNVFTIELLPLRQRRDDIPPLAEHFLSTFGRARHLRFTGFTAKAREMLEAYDYPGNARELRNIVERAAILAGQGRIDAEHLTLKPAFTRPAAEPGTPPTGAASDDDERARILNTLEAHRWNRRQAAEALGMPYSTLRYKLKGFGID